MRGGARHSRTARRGARVGSNRKKQPGLRLKHQGARAGNALDRCNGLQGTAVEDNDPACQAIADVAELPTVVQGDIMRLGQAGDFPGQRARLYIHHLHRAAMGNVKPFRGGVHGEVVPAARAAHDPGVLDGEGAAGRLGGRGGLLRAKCGDQESGDHERQY